MTVHVTYARRPLARKSSFAGLTPLGANAFEGYASLFGVRDGAGDMVAPGAFAASLRRRGPAEVRLLYQHFAHNPIGVWDVIAEDARGLYVRGRLSTDIEQARDIRALLADGALNGLSIGFRTVYASRQAGGRRLLQVEKVPVYVSEKASAACVVPWGFVRLFDAAASGADPDDVRARIAPGQPDDAASDVTLPALAALLAADFGLARDNAGQLEHLEKAVGGAH